jgi:hypothetical protein
MWGCKGTGRGRFASSHGMPIDRSGRIYILDFGNDGFVQVDAYSPVAIRSVSLSEVKSLYRRQGVPRGGPRRSPEAATRGSLRPFTRS